MMPKLRVQDDAYRLVAAAHRISAAAAEAVKAAKHDAVHGLCEMTCSADVAEELWDWFDGYQHHATLLPRDAWKVHVCVRAKARIKQAMDADERTVRLAR